MNDLLASIDPNIVIPSIIAGYAAVRASKAEKDSRPVSNGFAYNVTSGIKGLEARVDNITKDMRDIRERLIDHIEDHD